MHGCKGNIATYERQIDGVMKENKKPGMPADPGY